MATSNILIIFAVSLFVSFVLSELFHRYNYPRVIGQLLAGILLGIPFIRTVFTPSVMDDISFLADLGIIFLLMLAGMEINIEKLKRSEKSAFIIAVFCALVPFSLGFLFAKYIGYSTIVSLILGICLSLTAEGTTLKVLLDMNVLNTKVGTTILGAGIIDDIFEVIFLSIILIISHESIEKLIWFPIKLVAFIILVYVIFKLMPTLLRLIRKEHSRTATFSIIIIFGLMVAILSQGLELGPIVGAFIAGVIIQMRDKDKHEEREIVKELKVMTFAFIIPFFFINIGLHMNFSALMANIWLVLFVLILAVLGKVVGAMVVTPLTDLSLTQTHIVGWGMNSRGAVELVIAEIARANGLIPIEIYSAVVIMAITTTLMFPFVLRYYVNKHRHALDE
ncbi:MAG: cation:proton antiporter [archaeon]